MVPPPAPLPINKRVARDNARRQPEFVDTYVGSRIRLRRMEISMSQLDLAAKLGIAFQQVQKYEVGRNRVSASRLVEIAEALGVQPSYFFEGAQRPQGQAVPATSRSSLHRIVNDPSMLRLLRTISEIDNTAIRERAAMVVRTIAADPRLPT